MFLFFTCKSSTMVRIGLISDTHHYLDENIFRHFEKCDEIWHAGDFGTIGIAEKLRAFRPMKGVYGNIDGNDIRSEYPLQLTWNCGEVRVFMTHIGGHPARYAPGIKNQLQKEKAGLFISGHSHLLKIIYDPLLECLHINPGAAGKQGWHKVRTVVRFTIDGKKIRDCDVVELGHR
jgi:putative phosphoesterase